jgi:agmatinase
MKTEMSEDKETMAKLTKEVNIACTEMTNWVREQSEGILNSGEILGLVGGDHSTLFGAIQAVRKNLNGDFGVLNIDVHADLRTAYQGFDQSHASIMYYAMTHQHRPQN